MLIGLIIVLTATSNCHNKGFYRKEVAFMSEREKQIIETFALIIPKLSESDKSYLLGLGEGMAIKVDAQRQDEEKAMVTA